MAQKQQLALDWNRRDEHEANARKRIALSQLERSTGDFQVDALNAIRELAKRQQEVTTDDVWEVLGRDRSIEGRALGAAMVAAAKYGLIKRTERTKKSLRVVCHRRDLRVWESLRCRA